MTADGATPCCRGFRRRSLHRTHSGRSPLVEKRPIGFARGCLYTRDSRPPSPIVLFAHVLATPRKVLIWDWAGERQNGVEWSRTPLGGPNPTPGVIAEVVSRASITAAKIFLGNVANYG